MIVISFEQAFLQTIFLPPKTGISELSLKAEKVESAAFGVSAEREEEMTVVVSWRASSSWDEEHMTAQNPWRTLGSRTVYRNSWLTLREDSVIRPDGAEGIYSVVEMRPSCGVVAITDDNQIALVGQWRYVHNKYSIEIPTGGSEQDEIPLDAAKRELLEETGLTAREWTALGTIDNSNGATTDVAHLFLARNLTVGAPVPQGDEQVELRWMPFVDAVLAVMRGEITESVSVAGILKTELLGRVS